MLQLCIRFVVFVTDSGGNVSEFHEILSIMFTKLLLVRQICENPETLSWVKDESPFVQIMLVPRGMRHLVEPNW